jgi:hypothetical protein
MAEKKNVGFLRIVLAINVIVCFAYGICYFIVPDFLVKLSGDTPVFHGWLRWSGGILIALAIGSIQVYNRPQKQGIFVQTLATGYLLTAIALFWAWTDVSESANLWFTILPAITSLLLAILLYWSQQTARDVLFPKEQ